MKLSLKHGRIAVAIMAMGTLGAILFECSTSSQCDIPILAVIALVAIIGSTLDIDINIFNRGQDGNK